MKRTFARIWARFHLRRAKRLYAKAAAGNDIDSMLRNIRRADRSYQIAEKFFRLGRGA